MSDAERSKVVFCRVYGFRVRVWRRHIIHRSSRYGYESVTELTKVTGIVARAYRTHTSSGRFRAGTVEQSRTRTPGIVARATEVPGTGLNVTEVSGTDTDVVQNS